MCSAPAGITIGSRVKPDAPYFPLLEQPGFSLGSVHPTNSEAGFSEVRYAQATPKQGQRLVTWHIHAVPASTTKKRSSSRCTSGRHLSPTRTPLSPSRTTTATLSKGNQTGSSPTLPIGAPRGRRRDRAGGRIREALNLFSQRLEHACNVSLQAPKGSSAPANERE